MALDRSTVIGAALDLLDEVGLDSLTLRRIADRLGVKAPAIYWHFRNKQELLDEMATEMLRASVTGLQLSPGTPWTEAMQTFGRITRRSLLSRRDGGKLFGGTYLTDASLVRGQESLLQCLTDAGFTLQQAVQASRTTYCFVLGFVIEEQGTFGREALFDPSARRSRLDAEQVPLATQAGEIMFGDYDPLFEAGLSMVIAGAERLPSSRS